MGVIYCLIRATPETIAQLKGRPQAVAEFISKEPDSYQAPPGEQEEDPASVPDRREGDELGLDKAWDIVHYLLTGSDDYEEHPLSLIKDERHHLADIYIGGLSLPYLISPADVAAFATSAEALTDDDFFARYNPEELSGNDLYCVQDDIEAGYHEDVKKYALENFHALRRFARQAADNGEALITYYS